MSNPDIRSAFYAVLAALTALVVAYGLITKDEAALWLALGKTVIDAAALIMASRYVPDAPDAEGR